MTTAQWKLLCRFMAIVLRLMVRMLEGEGVDDKVTDAGHNLAAELEKQ